MTAAERARRARVDMEELVSHELDVETFQARAVDRLRRTVGFDSFVFKLTDPDTKVTNGALSDMDCRPAPTLYRHEYGGRDYASMLELAESPEPVQVLSHATGGDPSRSPRWRDVLAPYGVPHELKAAVREQDRLWGELALFREGGRPDFDADDVRAIESAMVPIARGLREAVLRVPIVSVGLDHAPAVVVLDADNRITGGTPMPDVWMDSFRAPDDGPTPLGLQILAMAARSRIRGSQNLGSARSRQRCADGSWLAIHATAMDPGAAEAGEEPGNVAIVVQPARAGDMRPLVFSGLGLTRGERDVTDHVLKGRSTKEIAAALYISPYTVQDRLREIFTKVGVRSRRELVARLDQRLGA